MRPREFIAGLFLLSALFELYTVVFGFVHDGDIGIGAKAHLVAFDFGDEIARDVVVMVVMVAFAAIFFGQLDAAALDTIHGADMDAIRADHFHMFLDA